MIWIILFIVWTYNLSTVNVSPDGAKPRASLRILDDPSWRPTIIGLAMSADIEPRGLRMQSF